MTPGARDRATERDASRGPGRSVSRVGLALGVSVVLHALGAVALWRGASEPVPRPERPPRASSLLDVELVWREVAKARGTGRMEPLMPARSLSERVSRPAPAGRSHERVTDTFHASAQAPTTRAERVEPPREVRADAPASSEPEALEAAPGPEGQVATAPVTPEGGGEGAPGGGLAGGGARGGDAEGVGTSGGGVPEGEAELKAYGERLSRHITRQRRYPAQAVRLGMEGIALVRIRVNRDGSLGAPPRLEGSSRFRVLDAEALRMVEAAAPFSPLPAAVSRDSAELVIPVRFSLRDGAG